MKINGRLVVALALVLTFAFSSTSFARPCQDCDGFYSQCLSFSFDNYNACVRDCLIPPPVGPNGISLCQGICLAEWLGRNAICDASYLTCITRNATCEGRPTPDNPCW